MVDESGKTLGVLASIIGCVLLFVAFLLLKTDPIRNEGGGRTEAIQQVKAFANFIQTKPELARPKERSVITMARSRMDEARGVQKPNVNVQTIVEFSWDENIQPYLSQVNTQEGRDAIRDELKLNPVAVMEHIEKDFQNTQLQRDHSWENKMEVLLILNEDALLNEETKQRSLDLIAEQLVQARTENSDLTKAHSDSWFERYLKLEKRANIREQRMNEFNEKIIHSVR